MNEDAFLMSTKYEPSGFDDTCTDEYGAVYTFDYLKLVKGVNISSYKVNPSTLIICDKAFDTCDRLESIELPESIKRIGKLAFFQCFSLKSISFPETLLEIGDLAFSCCTSLESVVLPDFMKSLGKYAFDCCTKLESIIIPDSIHVLRQGLFNNCESLHHIEFPYNTIPRIESAVFHGCSSLDVLNIPEGTQFLEEGDFRGMTSLKVIKIPSSIKCVLGNPFVHLPFDTCRVENNCERIVFEDGMVYSKDGKTLIACFCNNKIVKVREGVLSIAASAFKENDSIIHVYLPSSLRNIDHRAFQSCKNLKSVRICDNTKIIGDDVFCGCVALEDINLPDSVIKIGADSFKGCKNLKNIKLPKHLHSIETCCFMGCEKLINVQLPQNIVSIEKLAFADCKRIEDIHLPDTLRTISDRVFDGCMFEFLELPPYLTELGNCIFGSFRNVPLIVDSCNKDLYKAMFPYYEKYIFDKNGYNRHLELEEERLASEFIDYSDISFDDDRY